jgi:hypothetical protein
MNTIVYILVKIANLREMMNFNRQKEINIKKLKDSM